MYSLTCSWNLYRELSWERKNKVSLKLLCGVRKILFSYGEVVGLHVTAKMMLHDFHNEQ